MSVIPEDFTEIDKLIGYKPTPKPVFNPVDVSGLLDRMWSGASSVESGGSKDPQRVRNPRTGAIGLVQVLPENVRPWTKKHYKRELSPEEYANDPNAQRAVFDGEMGDYLRTARQQNPNADDETIIRMGAAGWYGGKGAMKRYDDPIKFRPNEASFREYTSSVAKRSKQATAPAANFDDIDKLIGYGKFAKTPVDDFAEIDALIGYQPTQPAIAPEDTGTIYGQPTESFNAPQTMPETDETMDAQIDAALLKESNRYGVLATTPEQNGLFANREEFKPFVDKDGRTVWLVKDKIKKLGLKDDEHIQNWLTKNPSALSTVMGKAAKATDATGDNQPAVTTTIMKNGVPVEGTSTVIVDENDIPAEIKAQKSQFPDGQTELTTTDAVVGQRLAPIADEYGNSLPLPADAVPNPNDDLIISMGDEKPNVFEPSIKGETKQAVVVTKQEEHPDGTATLTFSDGTTSRVKYQKNEDGSLTPVEIKAKPVTVKPKTQVAVKAPKNDPFDEKQFNAANEYLSAQGQPLLTKEQYQSAIKSFKGGTSVSLPTVGEVDGQVVVGESYREPVQMREIDSRDAKAVGNAFADVINIPANIKTRDEAAKYAGDYLRAKYPNGDFSFSGAGSFPSGWNPGDPIGIEYDTLTKAGVDIEPDIRQKIVENRTENPKPNLQVGKDWVKEDAEWLNSNAGKTLKYVNPLFDFLDDDTKNSIASSAIGGAIGSGARVGDAVAGIARWNPLFEMAKPLTGDLSAKMREMSKPGAELELKTGDDSTTSKMFKIAGAAPGDLSRLILLTRFGGAITGGSGVIVGMAADQGLQSAGRQESPWEVAKQTGKGAIIGTIFAAAPTIGKIGGSAVAGGKLAKGFSKEAFTASTIAGGTYATEKAFGTPEDQATQAAIINTLFHLTNTGVKLAGKAIKARDSQGRETNVYVDPDGNIKLLKGEVSKPDVEMYVETAKGSDGVYRTKGDTTPDRVAEEPYSVGNRGNKIGTSREPAQLEQQNPYRIPQAKPEAVAKAAEDPRVQKLATILKSGEPMSIEDLKKSSRYSPENVTDAVDTLVQARLVEILPDNTVRLIGEAPGKANVNLFEKYTNPQVETSAQENGLKSVAKPIEKPVNTKPSVVSDVAQTQPNETIDTSVYESLPERKAQVAEVVKPKAEVITEERPDHVKTLNVFTERGTKAAVEPKVIDASDLLTSMDEGYPAEYQPRDRSRIASKAQISKIASDLNPEFLGDSPKAGDGRPLVVPVMIDGKKKYAVISGNGRTEAIREAYAAQNEGAGKYRDYVTSKGETEHKTPVYVGILDPNATDLNKFAHEANESAQARMSPTEQAKADAERMDAGTMQSFVPADDGSIHREANRDFIRGFFDNTVGEAERAAYILPDGSLNQDGINRVRNAIFAKAFGDTKEGVAAIQRMAESTSDSVKNVTNALLGRAPHIAAYKESAAQGMRHKEFDIGNDLAAAVAQYANIKSPDAKIKSVDEYIAQGNMFGAETTPFQTRVMQVFDQHKRSPKAIKSILDNFLSAAHAIGDPNQQSIFGKTDLPSVESIFEGAVQAYERNISAEPTQASIFEENQRVQPETVGSPQGYQVAPATSIETQQERTPTSSVGGSGSNNPPPPPTDGDEPPRKRANRGITSIPDATETPKAERDLKPIPLSVKRSMVRREMAKKDADPQLIADAYGLTKQQVEDVRELGPVGKYGQMSHILRAAMADDLELLNKFAKVILPEARVNENNPLFDTQDAASAILDKAAELMGYGRSSEMGKIGLNKFLDTFADKLPMEAVVLVHDAIAHYEEWYRKRAKFAEEVANSPIMDDIIRQSGTMGRPTVSNFKEMPDVRGKLREASLRGRVLAIAKKYAIEKDDEGNRYTGLSRPVIEQAFNEALEKAFRERTNFRISTPGTGATSGNINQEGKSTEGEREVDQGDIQFANIPDEPDLIAVHNLSEANLLFADRLGGLALPSIAITKKDAQFSSFGEITLLADKSLIDPQNRVPVTDADMYSPRYPSAKIYVDRTEFKKIWDDVAANWLKHYEKPPNRSFSEHVLISDLEDRGMDALEYNEQFQAYALNNAGIRLPKDPHDLYKTVRKHYSLIEEAAQKAVDDADGELKFFKGWTYSGKKQLGRYDLETVVKKLKAEMKEGEGFNYGAGTLRSKGATRFKSIKQIQANRDRIVSAEDIEEKKDEMQNRLFDLAQEMAKYYEYSARGMGLADTFSEALGEGSARKNLRRSLEGYGFKDIENEDFGKITAYLNELVSLPTEYFEAKPQRAVSLREFEAAVVPKKLSPKARAVLEKNKIPIYTYKDGDKESRQKAVEKASAKHGIQFTNAFDQTDLFGNPVSPMTSQGSLFDMGEPVKKAEVDLTQFVDKKTADFLRSLEKSSDKTVAKAASTIIGSARYARSKDAKTVIEDAADALDAFSRAKHAHTTVANILKQQTFDKQTVGEMLSPRSTKLAEAMEAGHLGRTLNSDLNESNVQFAEVPKSDIQFDANAKSVKRENFKAKQMIKAARALSPLAVAHRAKVAVDPKTRLLQAENMEALAVIHEAVRAIDPEKYGQMSFSGASFTPRAAQELLDVFNSAVDHATATGDTRIATALSKIGNAVEAAIDPKHGDLVVSINIPSLPQLSKHTAQEELSHRNNRRSGARDIFADIAVTPSIQKSLANLGPGYARIGVTGAVDEVIAKSFRDDAETELNISSDDVWKNLTEFWRGATDAGIEVAQYGNISKTGKRFDKFVAGERAKRDVQAESERAAIRNTRSGDLQDARRKGDQRSPQTRTVSKDDRLAKLRQTELSTASGGSGLALLDPPALTPLQERYIALRAKGDIELQKDLATDVRFSHWGSVNINGKSLALKVKGVAIDIANAPRAIKASSDLSAAGRQGLISSVNHPVLATRAFMKQLSMLPPKSGARRYEKFKRDLDLHPFIELAETSGLHLTSMGDGAMSHREEAFMSQILGDDPYFTRKTPEAIRKLLTFPVRASERAYVTFLDYMRINTFASLAKELHRYNVRKGKPDEDAQYEALASWVNNATGRGDLGMLDNAAPILNATFFSARYWKSRLQVLNPRYYQKLPPGARKLAIREMLTFVAAFASVMAILKALGFKIETGDEDNPDLLTLRLGNYSYEFSAGLIGHLRYITRMVMSVADPGKRGTLDSMQYLTGRYLRAKLAPIPGAVVNTVDKKNYIGEPTSAKEEAMGIFTPIMADNFKDAVKADGIDGAVKMLPEFFGISTTRYSKPDEYQTKIQEERAKPANTPAEREEQQRRIKLWQSLKNRAAKYQ